jgi:hypothetical protein
MKFSVFKCRHMGQPTRADPEVVVPAQQQWRSSCPIQSKILEKTGFNTLPTTLGDMDKDSFVRVRDHVQSSRILGFGRCVGGQSHQKATVP